ncbi:tyrosine-type recombinase/integrase, partial [Terasakiella pusilla]|uniref:tyrosine-type recombinase/integrase n=1 Tax=Terasakiella pusilla TaxID=64973 RepID=UPI003AA7CE12
MAGYSIEKRGVKYRCLVRWTLGNGKRASKSKTFSKKARAEAWGKMMIGEIEEGLVGGKKDMRLSELIDAYLDAEDTQVGRSKRYSLEAIRNCDIAQNMAGDVKPFDLTSYCRERKAAGAGPSTVGADVSNLRSIYRDAHALFDLDIDEAVFIKSMPTLRKLKLVAKGQIRTRRPNEEEFKQIEKGLEKRQWHPQAIIPFVDIFNFSILSCMRIGEVCRIRWEDLNEDTRSVIVRQRKDPRKKDENHMAVPLIGGAFELVMKQPRTADCIFPYKPTSVSAGYQDVLNNLDIKNLTYHDFRREGASRLRDGPQKLDRVLRWDSRLLRRTIQWQ